MDAAFYGCRNLTVSATDVPNFANVTDMAGMFYNATNANPNVSQRNTSSVTHMSGIFSNATNANPDVTRWDTSNVTDMSYMFRDATNANPDVSQWNVTSLTNADRMFDGSGLSTANYEALLANWSSQAVETGVLLGAGRVVYCSPVGAAGRSTLTDTYGWTITDGGQCTPTPTPTSSPTPTLAVPLAASGSLSLLLALFGVALLAAVALRRTAGTP